MPAGRPTKADPGALYIFAHQFYWDFRQLLEGAYRTEIDQKRYARLIADADKVTLNKKQETHAKAFVREEIEDGRTEKGDWRKRLTEVRESQLHATRRLAEFKAGQIATIHLKVPGEPDVIDDLLKSQIPEQITQICADAPNWPISVGSVLPMHLSRHAASLIAAKNDPRFPRSERPTTRLKQLWFLSRALAGAVHNVAPRTAINLVGSKRPEETFQESRAAKPIRKPTKSRRRPG